MTSRKAAAPYRDAGRILTDLAHHVAHMGHDRIVGEVGTSPRPDREPVRVRFGRPRQLTSKTWARIADGPRYDLDGAGVHLARGGWRLYDISLPDLYTYATLAAERKDALAHLTLMANIVPASQLVLSEAAGVIVDLMALDPRPGWGYPRETANYWAGVGIDLVNYWQARQGNQPAGAPADGLGDVAVLAERIHHIRNQCALWQIRQAELDLEARQAKFRGGAS